MQMLTGIDQSDYSKIENGKRYYTFEQCRRIAEALGTSMDYLVGLTDEDKPYPRRKLFTEKRCENGVFCFAVFILGRQDAVSYGTNITVFLISF